MTWTTRLERLCDTSWIYWIREYAPHFIKAQQKQIGGPAGLPRLCNAICSPLKKLVPSDSELGQQYVKDVRGWVEDSIVGPLCASIEEDLRHYTFAVTQTSLDKLPPCPKPDIIELLRLRPVSVGHNVMLHIKDQVERRLTKSMYNLNAATPNEGEIYARIRSLAKERYALNILDGYLPEGSLNNSLDVISIMRNIHLFALRFNYSLHQQIFTQGANKGDKDVRVITVEHLANSIKTHGTGVINTTVNYTYGFVKRKLEVVVAFLQDEEVKSKLLFEERYAQERRLKRKPYAWSRAHETRSHIRKEVGTAADGVPLMDKFVQTVCQIGNAVGYVRMVRNAGMRCNAKSLPYVQVASVACAIGQRMDGARAVENDMDKEAMDEKALDSKRSNFEAAAGKAGSPQTVLDAAKAADNVVETTNRNFEASTDYLNIIAEVFGEALKHMKEEHGSPANLFHLLVPAMTLSFIDSLRVCRQALMRRAVATVRTLQSNAACFDDGFAVGVALILRIFGSDRDFQALHWFATEVTEKDAQLAPKINHDEFYQPMEEGPEGRQTASEREMLTLEFKRFHATFDSAFSLFGSKKNPPPEEHDDDDFPDAPPDGVPESTVGGDDEELP